MTTRTKLLSLALLATLWWGQPAQAADRQVGMPDPYRLAELIYTAISALDQANATGNYTVLHALAAPAFQAANSADGLAQVFAKYRELKVTLADAVLYEPHLLRKAELDGNGILRVEGFFPTEPLRIRFDLSFVEVGSVWRLIAIAISPVPAQPA